MIEALTLAASVLGLLIGSFLNVVIYRIPLGESIVMPASACPSCKYKISWFENLPIVSWIFLKGRCSNCGSKISIRYALVEALTALVFGLVTYIFLESNPGLDAANVTELLALLVFFSCGIALAFIDLDHFRLPTKIIVFGAVSITALLLLTAANRAEWAPFQMALIGAASLFAFFGVVHLIVPSGMGRGDVNLAGLIGLQLGWYGLGTLMVGAFLGFLLGATFGIALMVTAGKSRKTKIPFGPWMILGAWTGLWFGEQIWLWYLSLNGIFA